jgi:hypothetical protein
MRVLPCLTVRVLRSNASFTKRSVSSRIACFDISRFVAFKANLTFSRRQSKTREGFGLSVAVDQCFETWCIEIATAQ